MELTAPHISVPIAMIRPRCPRQRRHQHSLHIVALAMSASRSVFAFDLLGALIARSLLPAHVRARSHIRSHIVDPRIKRAATVLSYIRICTLIEAGVVAAHSGASLAASLPRIRLAGAHTLAVAHWLM